MAKSKPLKTNVARLLDAASVSYRLVEYPVDEQHLEASHVASAIGEDINRVFKTLVLRGDRTGHLVAVVPGNREIDLKKLARLSSNKKVEMIHQKELLPLTGYIRGGCSPIGMKKPLPTFFHKSALSFDEIYVSAGMRGLQLCIEPSALIDYVGAVTGDIATE